MTTAEASAPDDLTDSGLMDLEILITAAEAYPAMERAFLAAQTEIWASYRIFDLTTKLRSPEGCAIGDDWFDLIVHTLSRGVKLRFVLSDFDPVLAPKLHRAAWRSRRAFVAAGEAAGSTADLKVTNAKHCARTGNLPRLLLWPRTVREVGRLAREMNKMPSGLRARRLNESPGLRPWLKDIGNGVLRARKSWAPPLVPGTHHQKIAVFDRHRLCIGGLDLDERRYDDTDHRRARDETWHDVQLLCSGPVVAEAQTHLEEFLTVNAGKATPSKAQYLLRTLSRPHKIEAPFLGPRPLVAELYDAHILLIGQARRLIYLETQFFRDLRIADALAEAAAAQPDLDLILVVPGAPEDVAFDGNTGSDARFGEGLQARCISRIQEAFGDRLVIASPVRPMRAVGEGRDTLNGSPIIYVHAKVSVFDDARAIVSSANLNARSLAWDTEAGVVVKETSDVRDLRERAFRHWLCSDAEPGFFDIDNALPLWRDMLEHNGEATPEDRKGFLVPHDPEPARRFGRYVPLLPHALV